MVGCLLLGCQSASIAGDAARASDPLAATVVLEQGGVPKCLGLHLSSGVILTAQHCVRRYPRLALREAGGESVDIVEQRAHPSLDVALLRAARAPSAPAFDVTRVVYTPPAPDALVRAIFTNEQGHVAALAAQIEAVPDELVVAYRGRRGPCNGDSGAALVVEREGEWTLAGLLRGGARGCHGPDRYVRADAVREWLSENVRGESTSDDSPATREVRRLPAREKP